MTTKSLRSILAFSVAALAVAVVAGGLIVIDSPRETRLQRLDELRIRDLREISRSVALFWTVNKELPDALAELADVGGVTELPTDPETGVSYGYQVIDSASYELCAVFARSSERRTARPADKSWSHAEGPQCFELAPTETTR